MSSPLSNWKNRPFFWHLNKHPEFPESGLSRRQAVLKKASRILAPGCIRLLFRIREQGGRTFL